MEALYKKLYDKYTKLKSKKLSELDHLSKDQEVKFLNYVSAAEELIQHMKSENDRLRLQVNELRGEMVSIRSNIDAKCADYQNLLMEENQKNNTLSQEVEKLRKFQQEGYFGGFNNERSNEQPDIPCVSEIVPGEVSKCSSGKNTRKRFRDAAPEAEELRVVSTIAPDDTMLRQSTNELSQKAVSSGAADIQQPECCGRNVDQSGYSFSLTWVNHKLAGDAEILYRVLSLGTFERVAPEWMKEAIMFSTSMCPMFFERVTRVMKLHC